MSSHWKHDEPQPDPLPVEECDCSDRAPKYENWECPKCGAFWAAETRDTEAVTPTTKAFLPTCDEDSPACRGKIETHFCEAVSDTYRSDLCEYHLTLHMETC